MPGRRGPFEGLDLDMLCKISFFVLARPFVCLEFRKYPEGPDVSH